MNYQEKDVVWVKISRYPWWPAKVFKVETPDDKEGPPVILVQFFNEDYINPIKSKSKIRPFMCKEKEKFLAAGLKEKGRASLFQQAYELATKQVETGQTTCRYKCLGKLENFNPSVSENHNSYLNAANTSHSDNSIDSPSSGRLNYHAFKSDRFKTKVNWNGECVTSSVEENKNQVNGARKNKEIPTLMSDVSKKRKLTFDDQITKKSKSTHVTNDEHYNCDLPSLSRTSTPKAATKNSGSKINIIKTFTKLSHFNQKHKLAEGTKEKNDSKTSMISESETAMTPKSSIITMTPKSSKWEESFELPTPCLSRTAGLHYDPNLDKDECDTSSDSDTELPEGLSPIIVSRGEQLIHEKDIIWLRVGKLPVWPAYVRKIYKKKKRIHKLSVVFIEGCDQLPKRYRVTYKPKTMVPFFDKQKQKFMEEGETLSDPQSKVKFKESCEKAESYLHQKALSTLNKAEFSFFNFINSDDEEEEGSDCSEVIPPVAPDSTILSDVEERLSDNEDVNIYNGCDEGISSQGPSAREMKRLMKMTAKQENLVNFIKTDEMKNYLFDIFYKKKKSERHQKYFYGSVKEQNSLKYAGFGPIYSEEQEEEIVECTKDWLFEIPSDKRPPITYILDVWIPEAVVYAMIKVKKYCRKKAWEQFWKGTRTTKEERDRQHQSLLDFRGYTEEELAEIKQKSEERLKTKLYQIGIVS